MYIYYNVFINILKIFGGIFIFLYYGFLNNNSLYLVLGECIFILIDG